MLHDLDWEEHDDDPENHTVYAAELIAAAGGSPELIRAIQTHNSDFNPSLPEPELQMEKVLFATEELTGSSARRSSCARASPSWTST